MKKKVLKIILSIIILFSIIIAYGSIVGGDIGIIHFIVLTIISFLLILFIFGKSLTEKSLAALLCICIFISALSMGIYYGINIAFDNKEPIKQYQIQISDLPVGKDVASGFYYFDESGNEVFYSEFRLAPFDFEIGDIVNVEEYNGTFGVKHYKFSKA